MKILFIWDGDYPWDIRVEKVCESLCKGGHEIHMVCRNLERKIHEEIYEEINIHRLPYLPYWMGHLNKAYTFPAFFSPVWLWKIYKEAKQNRCELIIVRDLPMAIAGIWVSKILKIPCILDMAECYPEMLRCTWQYEGFSLKNIFLRNPLLGDWVEKYVVKHVRQIWVMIEESRLRLIRMGVPDDKIYVISNTPKIERFKETDHYSEIIDVFGKYYTMIYVGLLNPSRGLDTVFHAVCNYIKINSNFRLLIIGKGKAEQSLKELVNKLGISYNVRFLGWIDNKYIPSLISQADVGIVPHHKCSHWDNTIPNKLFDYMAAKKPVIVSNVVPMERIVNQTKCGLVYKDYDHVSLCNVFNILSNPELRHEFSHNGYTAVVNKYNWRNEEKYLFEAISKINLNNNVNGNNK